MSVFPLTTSKQFSPSNLLFRVLRKAVACTRLSEIGDTWKEFDVIGIDEGQFFEDVSLNLTTKTQNYIDL